MFLAFGWGRLFWQHCALQYGKRPVYLISILATMVIQVWTPYTKSNGKWIVNKVSLVLQIISIHDHDGNRLKNPVI